MWTIPLFAAMDRLAGSSLPLPGRQLYWAVLFALPIMFFFYPLGAVVTLLWGLWRLPAWKIGAHGGLNPSTWTDAAFLFLRHLAILFTAIPLVLAHFNPISIGLGLFVWALFATLLGVMNTRPIPNWLVELLRGAAYGAFLCVILV